MVGAACLVCAYILGVGIFELPRNTAALGLSTGTVLFAACGGLAAFTGVLLANFAAAQDQEVRDHTGVGKINGRPL